MTCNFFLLGKDNEDEEEMWNFNDPNKYSFKNKPFMVKRQLWKDDSSFENEILVENQNTFFHKSNLSLFNPTDSFLTS